METKYTVFTIPKRSGGVRTIAAPDERLKLLQQRLADILYNCQDDILDIQGRKNTVSHGFEKKKSVFTNAWPHKNRRYVLNLDLEDFFPSINFGRVRGFFINDRHFALHPKTATIISQIACFENQLPQGSPCSPVISNLIAHILDIRLAKLAKNTTSRYTRYADDITFSTNAREFPSLLAAENPIGSGHWHLAVTLVATIQQARFAINESKTRMQCRPSRQTVTGLTVNEKVNVRALYYRQARSKCHALFRSGEYHTGKPSAASVPPAPIQETAHLEGVLSYIYHLKHQSDERSGRLSAAKATKDNRILYPAYRELYKHFLYFKRFVNLDKPLIVCEGKTDNIYLRSALKNLAAFYPRLGKIHGKEFISSIRFLKHGGTEHEILELSGGSAKLASLVGRYAKSMKRFRFTPLRHPVIVLVDNDDGANEIFKSTKEYCKPKPTHTTTDDFYFVNYNLYIVKTPEIGPTGRSCIENFFDPLLLATTLGGKSFNPDNDIDTEKEYGKFAFADRVVRPNAESADFALFRPLLDRIIAVLDDYASRPRPIF